MKDYLIHYGVEGMKWGVRRFQNADGTLTPAGKRRYAIADKRLTKRHNYISDKLKADRLAAKLGTKSNILNSGETHSKVKKVKDLSDEIRTSDARMVQLGRATVKQRVGTLSAGTIAAGAGVIAGMALSVPVVSIATPAIAALGTAYLYKLTTR